MTGLTLTHTQYGETSLIALRVMGNNTYLLNYDGQVYKSLTAPEFDYLCKHTQSGREIDRDTTFISETGNILEVTQVGEGYRYTLRQPSSKGMIDTDTPTDRRQVFIAGKNRMISRWIAFGFSKPLVSISDYKNEPLEVHHVNLNSGDDSVDNLVVLPRWVHKYIHRKNGVSDYNLFSVYANAVRLLRGLEDDVIKDLLMSLGDLKSYLIDEGVDSNYLNISGKKLRLDLLDLFDPSTDRDPFESVFNEDVAWEITKIQIKAYRYRMVREGYSVDAVDNEVYDILRDLGYLTHTVKVFNEAILN